MRKFRYRAPRFSADFPVRLSQGDFNQLARCKEISALGMKLELERPLNPDSHGTVHLCLEDFSFSVPFQTTSSQTLHGGIRFVYESEEQRHAVLRLVASLAGPKSCTSLALVDNRRD